MRELIAWLAAWYNWIFLLPLGTGMLFVFVELSLGGLSDFVSFDADVDVDLDVDVDVDVDADLDADADFGGFAHLLAWFGVGKVPITLLLEVMAVSFGGTGLLANAVAREILGAGAGWTFPLSLGLAAVVAPLLTRLVGGTLAAWMPSDASTALRPQDFVGEVGTSASRISSGTGQVRLAPKDGRPSTVLNVRLAADLATAIPRGMEVLITRYDANDRVYSVTPTHLEV